jgi:hypothetical protein
VLVLLLGVLLAPVGALIGAAIFFFVLHVFQHPSSVAFWEWVPGVLLFGTGLGMIAALPTTALVLPIAYALRERAEATPKRLAKVGAVAGFLISGGIMLAFFSLRQDKSDPLLWLFIVGIALDGAIAGGLCGATLGAILRWLRPEPRPGPHASPSP